ALDRVRGLDFDPGDDADREHAELRAAAVFVDEAGAAGFPITAMASRVGVNPHRVAAQIDRLVAGHQAVRAGAVLVAPKIFDRLKTDVVSLLGGPPRHQAWVGGRPRVDMAE